MHMTSIRKNSFRNVLRITALSTALSAGLLAAPAMAADETKPHSEGLVSTISDAAITTKVKAKMIADKNLKNTDISVSTFNGVVALSGTAPSETAKAHAEADAKSVNKVKDVDASAVVVITK